MKTTFALIMLAIAQFGMQTASAQQTTDGKDAGYRTCGGMSFESEKTPCMKTVTAATFINISALAACKSSFDSEINSCLKLIVNNDYDSNLTKICGKMSFSSEKNVCISTITNKTANPVALSACNSAFDSEVNSCLKTIVQPIVLQPIQVPPPVIVVQPQPTIVCEKAHVLNELDKSMNMIKNGSMFKGIERLVEVRNYLMNCMQ